MQGAPTCPVHKRKGTGQAVNPSTLDSAPPASHKNSYQTSALKILTLGASLVAPWLGVRLPMQGTRVRALVREEPTCRGATKPMCHSY